MSTPKMELYEVIELAIAALGLDEVSDDEIIEDDDAIEEMLIEKFNVNFHQFCCVAEALIPLTLPARSALTEKLYKGFTRDGESWVFKMEVEAKP